MLIPIKINNQDQNVNHSMHSVFSILEMSLATLALLLPNNVNKFICFSLKKSLRKIWVKHETTM